MNEQDQPASGGRDRTLDSVRVLATYAVVWLHASSDAVIHNPSASSADWWFGNIADSFSRWGVPVFVMLSGCLLIPRSRGVSPARFMRSRLPRILLPTAFWTIFYLALDSIWGDPASLSQRLLNTIGGVPYVHLWYMYMLIGLYVFAPVIQRAIDGMNATSVLAYTCLIFFISMVSEYTVARGPLFVTMFLPYIGYFVLGYLVSRYPLRVPQVFKALAIVVCGALVALAAGLMLPHVGSRAWDLAYDNLNPLVVLMSLFVFSFLSQIQFRVPLWRMTELSFGIYLIHPFWLFVLRGYGVTGFLFGPVVGVPLLATAAFMLSALTTLVLLRVKFMKRFV